jgi:hypothetical protein
LEELAASPIELEEPGLASMAGLDVLPLNTFG